MNGEDKELGVGVEGGLGGARQEKGEIEESAIKREGNHVLVLLKLGDAQSLLLALPTCISGSLETFKLHL